MCEWRLRSECEGGGLGGKRTLSPKLPKVYDATIPQLDGACASPRLVLAAKDTSMDRDELDRRLEIERRVRNLRGEIIALENSAAIDDEKLRALQEIVDDIEAHCRTANDR